MYIMYTPLLNARARVESINRGALSKCVAFGIYLPSGAKPTVVFRRTRNFDLVLYTYKRRKYNNINRLEPNKQTDVIMHTK